MYEENFDMKKVEAYALNTTDMQNSVSRNFYMKFKDSLRTLKEWSNL